MKNVYIYALIDPRNNHVRYIGKAKSPEDRYKNHYNSARDKNTHKRNWINSVRKDGLRPELLILDEVASDNWRFWEKFYISLYKTFGFKLVNYTDGGDGNDGNFSNKGTWKKGNIPHNKGIPCREETKQKIRDKLTGTSNVASYKPIIQYDLEYNEIKRYKCIKDAVDESNGLFIRGKISDCCNLKRNKHQFFIWRWDNGDSLRERDLTNNKRIPVVQYDMQLNEIRRFISLLDAQRNTGVNYTCIDKCCKGIAKRAGKYIWRYQTN